MGDIEKQEKREIVSIYRLLLVVYLAPQVLVVAAASESKWA